MKSDDFTENFVRDKLFNYVVNESFPEELYNIGSKVYITSVANVELEPVKKVGGNFLVEGAASLETETDIGEGDTTDGSYPLTFSLEFDMEGKIVHARAVDVDTSSSSRAAQSAR